jgi:hypothetical protein
MRCAAVCVCSIYSPAAAAEGSYHSALEIHSTPPLSLSLASSIARELKRWRFIIPCRAATAKNSRENEFTECVSVCEKYTANRCARYHERKEREQPSIFLIPAMLLNVYYIWSTYKHQYSGDAAAAVINTVENIYFTSAYSYYIVETIFFIEELVFGAGGSYFYGHAALARPSPLSMKK